MDPVGPKIAGEDMVAHALEMDRALVPYAEELLADIEELGSDSSAIVEVAGSLGLSAGTRVVDLGCGKGANALAMTSQLGFSVIGIDLHGPFVEHARRAALQAGCSERCTFRQGNIVELAGLLEPADLALFAALGDVLGPLDETMKILRQFVKPGGFILVSDVFLREDRRGEHPGFENYAGLETTRQRLTTWGDTIELEALDADSDAEGEDDEALLIARRAEKLAQLHPHLEREFRNFAQSQASQYEYIEHSLASAVWAIRRSGT